MVTPKKIIKPKNILGTPIIPETQHVAVPNLKHAVNGLAAANKRDPIVVKADGSSVFANFRDCARFQLKSSITSALLYRLSTNPRPTTEKARASMLIMRHVPHKLFAGHY